MDRCRPSRAGARRCGFTLVELLVVIAIVALLAALLLPVLNAAKEKAQGIDCMTRHRQLAYAWLMYADDNEGRITASLDSRGATDAPAWVRFEIPAWLNGLTDYKSDNPSNWDPNADLTSSPLWSYAGGSAKMFKCPGDKSTVEVNGKAKPRLRSMSMNHFAGGFGGNGEIWFDGDRRRLRLYRRMNHFVDPAPAQTFIFIDEREDSIDWGSFIVDMTGYPAKRERTAIIDYPASYHNGSGTLSFVDGHSEIKKWRNRDTIPPILKRAIVAPVRTPKNQDVIWLQTRTTRHIKFTDTVPP